MARDAVASFTPTIPPDAQTTETFQAPSATGCGYLFRGIAVTDVEAFYVEARRAVLAAGYVIDNEVDRRHDGAYGVVLRAHSPAIAVRIYTGANQATAVSKNANPWVVFLEFKQRCD